MRWVLTLFGSGVLVLNTMQIHYIPKVEKINKEIRHTRADGLKDEIIIMVGVSIFLLWFVSWETFQKWIWITEWSVQTDQLMSCELSGSREHFYSYLHGLTLNKKYSKISVDGYWTNTVWERLNTINFGNIKKPSKQL